MLSHRRIFPFNIIALFLLTLFFSPLSSAQLGEDHLPGINGLSSGSQAPPGLYEGYVYYRYSFDTIQTLNGTQLRAPNVNLIMNALATSVVTNKKFLGGYWGFTALVPVFNSRLAAPTFDISTSNPGFSDLYVQPFQFGWHLKRADVTAAYGFYAPTGRFTPGALDNTGLGQWANEFSIGSTVYLDPGKRFNLATLGSYEINSSKKQLNLTVGNLLTLEGGLGLSFFKGYGNIGAAYYAQWKTTQDSGTDVSPLVDGKKGSMLGVGPELRMPLGKLPILADFRYMFDVRSRFAPTGNTLVFGITYVLPFHEPKKK